MVDLGLNNWDCTCASAIRIADLPLERVREENQELELGIEWR